MKNLLFVWICLFFLLNTAKLSATHLISLDGYAECLSVGQNEREYKISLQAIRDASVSSVTFDQEIEVGVYGKADGILKKILTLPLIRERIVYQATPGQPSMFEAEYVLTIKLADLSGAYVLQYRRCCLPSTPYIAVDQGMELLIFLPAGMQTGQHTLKRNLVIEPVLKKNQTYTIPYPWIQNLYDSIRYESKYFFSGADQNNPIPEFPAQLDYAEKGVYKNGASAGNPFGPSGTWIKNTDSTWQVQINQSGYFLYPVSTICYLNGDSFIQTVLFPAISVDTLLPQLWLELLDRTIDRVLMATSIKHWNNTDSVMLQRHDQGMPQNQFVTIANNMNNGFSIPIADSATNILASYLYRIKLVSGGQTYYSNELFVMTGEVSVRNISEFSNFVRVYPNPASNRLTIQSQTSMCFELYSISGQMKAEGILEEDENILNIEHLPAGIYFLKTEFETLKIVVNVRR